MTRLHADPVEVQRHETGLGPEPAQFRWHGRPYVGREVLARWTEAGGWWVGGTPRPDQSGVYDLCFDGARGSWSLARVLD